MDSADVTTLQTAFTGVISLAVTAMIVVLTAGITIWGARYVWRIFKKSANATT